MQYLFLILSFTLISASVFSQEKDSIYTIVDEMPRFSGCEDIEGTADEKKKCAEKKMLEYIWKNIKYSDAKGDNLQGGCHLLIVSFVVEKDGCINGIEVMRGDYEILNDAYTKVVSEMPCWAPGKHKGKPVAVRLQLPARVRLED